MGGEFELPENTAPEIELIRSASEDVYGVVQLKRGTVYEACEHGQVSAKQARNKECLSPCC